jgi:hypothetical protein
MFFYSALRLQRLPPIILAILFALLWTIWIQPHTLFLRHSLLTLGSLIGLYVIFNNYRVLFTRFAIPIYLIGLLFVWVIFHLLFLSENVSLQLDEFKSIWKRIAWGTPFAIGLGIALGSLFISSKKESNYGINKLQSHCWWILFLGMLAPAIIYLCRYLATTSADLSAAELPSAFMLLYPPSSWYIPKTGYVFFCIPTLALACAKLSTIFRGKSTLNYWHIAIFILSIFAVMSIFYLENFKNGIIYSVILVFVLITQFVVYYLKRGSLRILVAIAFVVSAFALIVMLHLQKNDSWNTLFADIKVASQLDTVDHWKYRGDRGYPNNEFGKMVSITNYERAAWAQVAVHFIIERPQGYGLVLESFKHIAKEKWPESNLLQSHSGWLDLTMGIGIPGILLILFAAGLSIRNLACYSESIWGSPFIWVLSSIGLLMITTEVSQKVYLEVLEIVLVVLYNSVILFIQDF